MKISVLYKKIECTMTKIASDVIVAPVAVIRTINKPSRNASTPVITTAMIADMIGGNSKAFSPQGASGKEMDFIATGVTQIAAT